MPILGKLAGGLLNARAEQAMAARDAAVYGGDVYRPTSAGPETRGQTCGAAGCAGVGWSGAGWARPWKNKRRPVFENEWGCSNRCLTSIIRAAVRREVGDVRGEDIPHRHRVPLGLVLLAQGWITHPQLQHALGAQKASGRGRIGDWLAQSCGLPEERITQGLGVQWSCPVLGTDGFSPSSMSLVMPKRFIADFGLVPVRVAGSSLLYLAFENRMNAAAAFALEQMTGLKVESGLLPATQFAEAREALLAADAVPVKTANVPDTDALTAEIVKSLEQRQPVASRLVRVHSFYWMRSWLERGAMSGVGTLPSSTEDVEDTLFMIGPKA